MLVFDAVYDFVVFAALFGSVCALKADEEYGGGDEADGDVGEDDAVAEWVPRRVGGALRGLQ